MPGLAPNDRVKFAPPFFDANTTLQLAGKASKAALVNDSGDGRIQQLRQPGCNYSATLLPHERATQPLIRTGSHTGYVMRPVTDRTRALDITAVGMLANAHTFAASDYIGRPLNAFLTIVWRHSPAWTRDQKSWSTLQTRLMDKLTRWLGRAGVETAFVWVRETAPGKGCHTHVLIHLGDRPAAVRQPLIDWLREAFKFRSPEAIDISYGRYGARTAKMRAGVLSYISKGFDHGTFRYTGFETCNVGAELGIKDRGKQGIIKVKRSGASQNIGPAARKTAGWREVKTLSAIAELLDPQVGYSPKIKRPSSQTSQKVLGKIKSGKTLGTSNLIQFGIGNDSGARIAVSLVAV